MSAAGPVTMGPTLRDGAWGAISFLNAIPQGIGCAAAISLPVTVEVQYVPAPPQSKPWLDTTEGEATPLLRWTLDKVYESVPVPPIYKFHVAVRSGVPPQKGLKSSSAVSVALARALRRVLGQSPTPAEVATLSAKAALAAGVSVTGAFDDALACAMGGVVVADVRAHWQMLSTEVPSGLQALLWIPETTRPDLAKRSSELRAPDMNAKEAVRLALRGDYLKAMKYNSLVVERALGYDYAKLREAGLTKGALSAGVTGNGPAVAFVCPRELTPQVASALPWQGAKLLTAEFVRPGVVPA
ncbi:MAG: shikimate kinase [Euryarchaeota archaeon]|nr:shikimate kinase [Euryarchaeota archaeon]MDE1837111.1 shikimate kinase [Euryarchaeota archaeon]MDE1879677.1 shikimate kinase [Euryarchaeota archaeon]MDE2045203.1 shikimate kinase [Thermoplasmata archaeon]